MKKKRNPECQCNACTRFRSDGREVWHDIKKIGRYLSSKQVETIRRDLLESKCDWCDRTAVRAPFVPQIVKDFLRIENLCEWCRNSIQWDARKQAICWGSTSDDEIKWFLIEITLLKFNATVHALSPAQVAKDKAFQAWLDSLPKPEEPEELDIQLKPRFNIRRRGDASNDATSRPARPQ
jgi:hypothetical protein